MGGPQSGSGCRVFLYGHQKHDGLATLRYPAMLVDPRNALAPASITMDSTSKLKKEALDKEMWLRQDLGAMAFHAGFHRRLFHMFEINASRRKQLNYRTAASDDSSGAQGAAQL